MMFKNSEMTNLTGLELYFYSNLFNYSDSI